MPICQVLITPQKYTGFGQALNVQNHYLSTLRTIPIVGISQHMMQDIKAEFLAVNGVSEIVRSTKPEINRCWNILTDEANFYPVLKCIRKNLQFWLDRNFQSVYNFPELVQSAMALSKPVAAMISTGRHQQRQDQTPNSYATAVITAVITGPTANHTPNIVANAKLSSVSAMLLQATGSANRLSTEVYEKWMPFLNVAVPSAKNSFP
jgi:hypothetical protein